MPLNAEGLRLYPRRPYATIATSTFDYPLSSRFDESDSLVVLRDVFVPVGARLRPSRHRARQRPVLRDGRARPGQLPGPRPVPRQDGVRVGDGDRAGRRAWAVGDPARPGPARAATSRPSAPPSTRSSLAAETRAGDARRPRCSRRRRFVHAGISLQRRWVVDLMRALRELGGGGFIAMPSGRELRRARDRRGRRTATTGPRRCRHATGSGCSS